MPGEYYDLILTTLRHFVAPRYPRLALRTVSGQTSVGLADNEGGMSGGRVLNFVSVKFTTRK